MHLIIQESLDVIREAYVAGSFQQLHLLSRSGFTSHLHERGLQVHSDDLHRLGDFLQPVDFADTEALFHPYQTWIVHHLAARLAPQLSLAFWLGPQVYGLGKLVERAAAQFASARERFRATTQDFYRILAVISLAEPYYLPLIRGRLSLRDGNQRDHAQWRAGFDVGRVLVSCRVDPEYVRVWHGRLAMDAWATDSAREWYAVIRYARFRKRDRLRGDVRLAHDFYEIAEILRLLYREVTGLGLPPENEYGAVPWSAVSYKASEAPVLDRVALKRVARSFGLDGSYRGYWFVEGDTEEGFFLELAQMRGINLDEHAIALVNLGGGGEVSRIRSAVASRFRSDLFVEQLRKYRNDELFVFFAVDDDEGVAEGLEVLRNMGLLTAGFQKWGGDLEEANFQVEELIEIALGLMGATAKLQLAVDEVERERSKFDSKAKRRSLGEALVRAASRRPELAAFRKGSDWGKALARYAAQHPELAEKRRPAVEAFEFALSMSWADFQGSVAHLECDGSGSMVPKRAT